LSVKSTKPPAFVAAIGLGYHGLAVLREPGQTVDGVPSISLIDALLSRF
jgi:hypothetical protein